MGFHPLKFNKMTTYQEFEKAAIKEFRETYPEWNDEGLVICENGEIYVGNTQFKINTKLKDYE